ncbi:MAG: hypothetical protein K0Q58_1185, partial [Microbacterium sp.]|nr:hypothetical protein [Microbacterium sp.]
MSTSQASAAPMAAPSAFARTSRGLASRAGSSTCTSSAATESP